MNETTFLYRDLPDRSDLYCEDISLAELTEEFATPLYVYSKKQIVSNFRSFAQAINKFGEKNYVSYAIKANWNSDLLGILASEGSGASVVSGGELHAALKTGFDPAKITFDGPGKTDVEITLALRSNIFAIDIESIQELHVVNDIASSLEMKARICIRVNPHIDAKTHPYISTGLSQNKFGIAIDDAKEAYHVANELPNIEIVGIHCHIGSQITDVSVFIEAAESLAKFIEVLKQDKGISLKHINFGGGQATAYHDVVSPSHSSGDDNKPSKVISFDAIAGAVLPILLRTGCTVNVEPGRSIVANSGVLVTKVLYTKSNGDKNFVIVDAGMTELLRPSLYQAYHQIVPIKSEHLDEKIVDVVGPICETGDFFAHDRMMPLVERGDLLAVMCSGAYGYALGSNYNLRPRSAEVLVDGSSYRIIREREVLDDIM